MHRLIFALLICCCGLSQAGDFPKFEEQTLDGNVGKICYAVSVADVDGDKKLDLVAVTENRVVWFQNPDWKLREIIVDQTERDNVCIAPYDIDGDGQVDFALGAGWTKIGTIQWLARGKSLDDKWQVHLIGQEGWTHRMRWGDLLGTGKAQLVISPLNKTAAPNGVRLTAFEIPANPRTDRWKATVLDDALNSMHNHWMGDFDGDGKTDAITASQEGIFLFHRAADGTVKKQQLAAGAESLPMAAANAKGNGEIKVGKLKGKRVIAAVAPMHGNFAVVYTEPAKGGDLWTAHVLDNTLNRGHGVALADLDGDGSDEVIIGHSDKGTGPITGPGVYVYTSDDDAGSKWTKHVIDNGGIATEDLLAEDFNGDGQIDLAAGGRATHNVKIYWNRGTKK